MKKTKIILCLGIVLCMIGCSDDEEVTTAATVPFSLTASLTQRSTDSEDNNLMQGKWNEGNQLAVMKTGSSGIKKGIFTFSPTSTVSANSFTGNLSSNVKNGNEIAVFYPATAITATSSDTLTQVLSLIGQDGTPAGIANYDYSWALCKATMDERSGTADCEMTNLMAIGKFRFITDDATPLKNISRITITAVSGELYSNATVKLKDGTFSNMKKGSITIYNKAGISGTTYISFFPGQAQLHFTLVTSTGKVYETATSESIMLEKGKIHTVAPLTCTPLSPAKVGDYYYSDCTYSTQRNLNKTCIGIIYALNNEDGSLNKSLTASPFGRIVALSDSKINLKWIAKAEDIKGIENYDNADGTLKLGSLPYYKGTVDSFFSDKEEEQIKGVTINTETGLIRSWVANGALSDFSGLKNTSHINSATTSYPAGTYCHQYSTEGKGAGEWYLPAAGELALLWELQQTKVICNANQKCFNNFDRRYYWSSSENSSEAAWYLNFLSGTIAPNSKASNYNVRPVSAF